MRLCGAMTTAVLRLIRLAITCAAHGFTQSFKADAA
jgi:hypothetical protein